MGWKKNISAMQGLQQAEKMLQRLRAQKHLGGHGLSNSSPCWAALPQRVWGGQKHWAALLPPPLSGSPQEVGLLLGGLAELLLSSPGAKHLLQLASLQTAATVFQEILLRCRHWVSTWPAWGELSLSPTLPDPSCSPGEQGVLTPLCPREQWRAAAWASPSSVLLC